MYWKRKTCIIAKLSSIFKNCGEILNSFQWFSCLVQPSWQLLFVKKWLFVAITLALAFSFVLLRFSPCGWKQLYAIVRWNLKPSWCHAVVELVTCGDQSVSRQWSYQSEQYSVLSGDISKIESSWQFTIAYKFLWRKQRKGQVSYFWTNVDVW